MTNLPTDSPSCAHYISRYLPVPENWIYKIVINLQHYRPILLSRKKVNLDLFPIRNIYSLEDFSMLRQFEEIVYFKLFGYFNFFKRICVREDIKILHVHFGYHGVKFLGLKKKLKMPMICSFYGDDAFAYPRIGNNRKKYARLFRDVEKFLVLGTHMREELIKLGCPENKILIHHLGIDVDRIRFSKRSMQKGSKIKFLIASSFVQKKGIDLAIRALSDFKSEYDFSLDIIGDGPLKNLILKEIEDSGIKDRIILHGYKTYNDFIQQAYLCDVFIQASRTTAQNNKEGTPMALVDAMATGMPVISTKHSDIPEIVIDGENGYLAEENDLISLTNCIRKIFIDPQKIPALGLNGRAWIEMEFDAKKQAKKLEEHYTQVIQRYARA
jgi:colanic acid/amylovoran biosynthesis glycosyltransferase